MGLPELSESSLLASFLNSLLKNSFSIHFLDLDVQYNAYCKEEKDNNVSTCPEYKENGSLAKLSWLVINQVLNEQNDGANDSNGDSNDKEESEHLHPFLLIRK